MGIEEDILLFKEWAISIGAPRNVLPNENALKMIFRSKQNQTMFELIKRVRPKNEVRDIRNNILVSAVKKDEKVMMLPVNCPPILGRFKVIQDQKKKSDEIRHRIQITSAEIDKCKLILKLENMTNITTGQKLKDGKDKICIFEIKNEKYSKALEEEREIELRLNDLLHGLKVPSHLSVKKPAAQIIIEETLGKLLSAKQDVNYYKPILKNIPKTISWSILLEKLDADVTKIIRTLDAPKIGWNDNNRDCFDNVLSEAHTEHIVVLLDIKKIQTQCKNYETAYNIEFEPFYESMYIKLKKTQGENANEELFEEFIASNLKKSFVDGEVEYLREQIQKMKYEVVQNQARIDGNQLAIQSFAGYYENITNMFEQIRGQMTSLMQLKNKFIYCSNSIRNIVENMKVARANLNMNATMESFCVNESVMCSTKIGNFDSTMMDMSLLKPDTTIIPQIMSPTNTPVALTELQLFNDVPIYKFRYNNPAMNFCLHPNPFLLYNREIDDETRNMMHYHLLTGKGVQNELQITSNFFFALNETCGGDVKFNEPKQTEVDVHQINAQFAKQKELLTELRDQITGVNEIGQQTLKKCYKYFNFLLKNPLRKYVPSSIIFEGCNYQQLEQEFLLFYRILKHEESRK